MNKSERRALQNRLNGRKAKGAKTPEGIERSKKNAVKHGLLAADCVMADEDGEAFERLRAALYDEFEPVGGVESFLVDQIASTIWRLRRVPRIERDIMDCELERLRWSARRWSESFDPPPTLGRVFNLEAGRSDAFSKLRRYEAQFDRSVRRNLHELERLQLRRSGGEVEAPRAVDVTVSVDSDAADDAADEAA